MKKLVVLAVAAAITVALSAGGATASHSWGGYHWARTSNPFTIKVGNNLTNGWSTYLQQASSDWNKSTVAKNTVVAGQSSKRCRPTSGRDEICNGSYGNNGWLGVAQIWLSGSHITQGTVKVNDTYFNSSTYNNPNEKRHVMCQEVGHTWGLDHQSTSGAAYYTCMDYFSNTGANAGSTTSTAPNQGDYDELRCIYDPTAAGQTLTSTTNGITHTCRGTGHLDGTTTIGAASPHTPGAATVRPREGRYESVRVRHLRNGLTKVTFILWATRH